ncbi:MAG: acetate/propionate family kinase [Chlorobiaceae bacterium]|nr:acetate/propionate family kinase [Chlorobiaceae bacterium]
MRPTITILAVNTGSSSIKFSLFESGEGDELLFSGSLTRIGLRDGRFSVTDPDGRFIECRRLEAVDHADACLNVFSWIKARGPGMPDAVGHRIVHGGPHHAAPERVSAELLSSVAELIPYAPEHLPQALHAVRHAAEVFPGVFQVACFDTAFHGSMPPVARLYALPEPYRSAGVRRYGFHGLSYGYILGELAGADERVAGKGRLIIAHLGHGASMVAVKDGQSVETTMGFSPAGGLVMGTRTGDLDPGAVLFLLQQGHLSVEGLRDLVNRRSGMLGVSGSSDDMRDLLAAGKRDKGAREAVELFCYQARKHAGALAAVLGGVDMLVFTGGIGEHAPEVRYRICSGLEHLGIRLDPERNREGLAVISHDSSSVSVRVMKTNEELAIVRQTRQLLEAR